MGSCFGPIFVECHQGLITSTEPASFNPASWAWESGHARLFFKPNQLVLIKPYLRVVIKNVFNSKNIFFRKLDV